MSKIKKLAHFLFQSYIRALRKGFVDTSSQLYSNPLRTFTVLASVFFLGLVLGSIAYHAQQRLVDAVIHTAFKKIAPIQPQSNFQLAWMIFFNNASVIVLNILFTWTIIFPIYTLAMNGFIVGGFAMVATKNGMSPSRYFMALIPHGVLEIPAIILSTVAGAHLAQGVAYRDKSELKKAVIWGIITTAMLLTAAFIEAYVSSQLA